MKIAVISDIHLGRGDRADRKRGQDKSLIRLLDYLEADYDQIILLGDIWELLTPKCPGFPRRELKLVRAAHPELAYRFCQAPYRYIVGNHDRAIEAIESPLQEISLQLDQTHIIFTHGHQFDVWAHQLRYVGECVVWISGWASRLGTHSLSHFFDWLHNVMTLSTDHDQVGNLELKLIQRSIEREAHVTVIGHTHVPGITRHNGHYLVNSGHCLGENLHFVSIDSDRKSIAVYRVNPGQDDGLIEESLAIINQMPLPTSPH